MVFVNIICRHVRPQAFSSQETTRLEGNELKISKVKTLRRKISNSELLQVATQDVTIPVSVLIELDLPKRRVRLAPSRTRNSTQRTLVSIRPLTSEEQDEANVRIEQTKDFLEKTLGLPPRWLPSSRSFVAKVTSQQLQEIAMHETVKAIWPNSQKTFLHPAVPAPKPL